MSNDSPVSDKPGNDPLKGMEVRFGGRTLKIEILVNTDEDEVTVAERLNVAARGPKDCMSVITVGIIGNTKAVTAVWERLIATGKERMKQAGKT